VVSIQSTSNTVAVMPYAHCTKWSLRSRKRKWFLRNGQGIMIPLYKGNGSKSECSNYRGITLLSVPGKVFAHILARIKPTLLSRRRPQQSGFTPGHSMCDRIATLCNIAQQRQDLGYPTFAAFVDLRAAFDSLSRPALWLILTRLGIPNKIVRL